jgi:hypothetical protein
MKSLQLDAHATDAAIIIRYDIEASILDESGDAMIVGQTKQCQKMYAYSFICHYHIHFVAFDLMV